MIEPPQDTWLQAIGYAVLAGTGGFLGYLMRMADGGSEVTVARAILETFAAGFVGLLVLFMCQAFGTPATLTGVIVGISGWLGASASIQLLQVLVYKKMGLNKPGRKPDHCDKDPQP